MADSFKIGDTVIVSATKQSGKIVESINGRWKVKLANAEVLKESSELESRQMLFES